MRPAAIGLFEGYGGLTLAVEAVLDAELIAYSEYEPPTEKNPRPTQAAARLLAYRRPEIPNLGDITAIDWSAVEVDRDRMLILTGGFPCQDLSLAGLQAGMRPGTRSGLWSHMAYAIAELRPDLVVIENVRGLLSADAACDLEPCPWCVGDKPGRVLRALGAVLGDLADLRYDAVWIGLPASDVGAPHPRFRVFVLAWPAADPAGVGRGPARWDDGVRAAGLVAEPAADPDGDAVREQPVAEPRRSGAAEPRHARDDAAADAAGAGRAPGGPEGQRRPEPADAGDSGTSVRGRPQEPRRRGRAAADTEDDRHAPFEPRGHGPEGSWPAGNHEAAADADDRTGHGERARPEPRDGDEAASDAVRDGREGREERDLGTEAGQPAPHGGDAARRVLEWGDYGPAIRRWELILGRPAPAPTQTGAKGGQQLSPLFVEWMMGLPEGWVTDPAIGLTRNEQLARLGNGVVPQHAEAALRYLLATTAEARAPQAVAA